jgi:quinol monooxygenase YgiN
VVTTKGVGVQPLYLVAVLKPRLDIRDEVRAKVAGLVTDSLAEDGCEMYDLVVDDHDPDTWLMLEKWTSREHWDAHMLTDHVIAFNAQGDGLFREPTELRFYDPA